MTYANAARIFHCLKADLNENPILKQLKLQAKIESKKSNEPDKGTEIPKITYDSSQEKRNTLQLAFSSLKCKFTLLTTESVQNFFYLNFFSPKDSRRPDL